MPPPRALVIRTAGTNCDAEMVRAFALAGAAPELVHLDRLIAEPSRVEAFDLIGFPGGFSYGDDVASGRIFAMRARERLYPALRDAARRGVCMIGACNGFQVMVQIGLLPGPSEGEGWPEEAAPAQACSLAHNASGRFTDRWVKVRVEPDSPCVWTRPLVEEFASLSLLGGAGVSPAHEGELERAGRPLHPNQNISRADRLLRLPVAHGEGRFVAPAEVLARLEAAGQVALRYGEEVNGSMNDIAGVCDATGRIFGLMPHPERYLEWTHHPFWTRLSAADRDGEPLGLRMFRGAVEAVQGSLVAPVSRPVRMTT